MNRIIVLAFVACLLVIALTSSNTGVLGLSLGGAAFVVLMFACCVLPMLIVLFRGRSKDKSEQAEDDGRKAQGQGRAGCH